ncbi:Ubiquitin-like protease domain-containing protein [Forsythia ovata]|uniref:Ubiquitin-like protease domain-containing protein n=1 Tax=Forsythia ovata TaxID=205694 RepID=A0ABD1PJG5_9LAMI
MKEVGVGSCLCVPRNGNKVADNLAFFATTGMDARECFKALTKKEKAEVTRALSKPNSDNGSYDFQCVRRGTNEEKLGYSRLECDKVFVPIHKENHWCLAVINRNDKKFQYLDSLKGVDTDIMEVLARYFVDEVKDKTGKDIDVSSWEREFVENLPEQENWYIGEHISYFRRRTVKEILRLKAD